MGLQNGRPVLRSVGAMLVTLDAFANLARPSLDWVIHRLLPRPGTVILMGPPKVGKSFLALAIGLAVAQGKPFLGQPSVQGSVWYLQLDTSEAVWRGRIQDLREAGLDTVGPVYMAHPELVPRPFNILIPKVQTFIRECLTESNPSLIIVDVMRKLHSSDENDSTEMKRVSDVVDELFATRCVLMVHHTRKIREDIENPDVNSLSRGSSFITGQADALWLLFNKKLKIVSRFDEDVTYRAEQMDTGMWYFPDVIHRTEAQARALSLCAEHPELSHAKLAPLALERWGMSRASYYRYIAGQECAHQDGREHLRTPHRPEAPPPMPEPSTPTDEAVSTHLPLLPHLPLPLERGGDFDPDGPEPEGEGPIGGDEDDFPPDPV